ncbi:MANSC domain-containing protein 4 [Pseudophryne corroboree]|uniref:MANSC domain-containing protein 4 n=1 Tax=Pseudophryne corroboree TaxID=495146 RepID=UPI00308122F5
MAVNLDSSALLFFSLLDIPWLLCMSSALCPHTTFYHDCWIRRFPGLFLSFSASEQRGARVLRRQPEPTAQLCSRKCCDQESCNVAVFISETGDGKANCHLMHCPQPESCLVQLQERGVFFTVTAGVDPDLLVFDKLGHVDLNPRSSLKWERQNISRALVSPASVSPPVLTPKEPSIHQPSTSPPTFPPFHSSPQQPPPQLPSPADSPLRSYPPTISPSLTTPLVSESPFISASVDRSLQGGDLSIQPLPYSPPLGQPMSDVQSPAHLDSSKQHVNETKGHSGRNQSSDGETEDIADHLATLWPLPALIGSTVTLLCCCSGILALGCCRRKRRGRYRPGRARNAGRKTLIRCTLLREKD